MNDIQKKILEIYKVVKKICEQSKIPFCAIGGTCIGAIRHNGFIPWDDDLDIGIFIEDLDRFVKVMNENLPDEYRLYSCDSIEHNSNIFLKVMDINTTFIEKKEYNYPDSYKGIYIDVLVLGGIPKSVVRQKIYIYKIKIYSFFNHIKRFGYSSPLSWYGVFFSKIVGVIYKNKKYNYFSNKWINTIKKYPYNKYELTIEPCNIDGIYRDIFEASDYAKNIDIKFEDTTIPCAAGYDKILTKIFGDYMKLPKKKDRVTNHDGLIDINKSYEYYKKNGIEKY